MDMQIGQLVAQPKKEQATGGLNLLVRVVSNVLLKFLPIIGNFGTVANGIVEMEYRSHAHKFNAGISCAKFFIFFMFHLLQRPEQTLSISHFFPGPRALLRPSDNINLWNFLGPTANTVCKLCLVRFVFNIVIFLGMIFSHISLHILFVKFFLPYGYSFFQIFQALPLFVALHLFFLPNLPGPTLIPCPTSITDSRVIDFCF